MRAIDACELLNNTKKTNKHTQCIMNAQLFTHHAKMITVYVQIFEGRNFRGFRGRPAIRENFILEFY